jgi:protoporphyrinogen oxidase
MSNSVKPTAVIIGGGPAGLTAAYEFIKHSNVLPIVIEMSEFWGGISRTENHNGNRIDIGGHRFFSKSEIVMDWWQEILPIYSDDASIQISYQNKSKQIEIEDKNISDKDDNILLVRKRKSRIFFNKKFFDYPISLSFQTILNLGFFNTFLIGISYAKAVFFPIKKQITLEHFFINRFGSRLYKTFFKDYTEKVWGVPCSEISSEWGAQRIKGLSVTKTLTNAVKNIFKNSKSDLSQKNTETSLIEYFLYPKFGPGQMWETVAEKVKTEGAILKQNSKIVAINIDNNKVSSVIVENRFTKEKETIACDYCISTMPIQELIKGLSCPVPIKVKEIASGLMYRDFVTVGLLLDKINFKLEDNWIYIQESYVKVGRIQVFNNWSPFMVNDNNKIWVGLEYFCNETDEIWRFSESKMIQFASDEMIQLGFINSGENVLDAKVIKVPKTYPAYFGSYSEFNQIRTFTDTIENLFLVGRNGMHKYNNQDHSMLTAMQAVQNIINNHTDKSNIWSINTEEEYHEQK